MHIQQQSPKQHHFLARWFSLSIPLEPDSQATFKEREVYRQAELNSVLILIMLFLCIISIPAGFLGTNPLLTPILGLLFIWTLCAVPFNKQGKTRISGLIVTAAYTFGVTSNLATTPGGLSMEAIPLFTLYLMPEMLAGAMLPTYWVIGDAIFNLLLCWALVLFAPRTPDLIENISIAYTNGPLLNTMLQTIAASIIILVRRNLQQALRERDQAQEVARLKSDLTELSLISAQKHAELEYSIELILQTQVEVANGNLDARVPLSPDNTLWPVAGTLNNLLARLRRAKEGEVAIQELEHTREAINHLIIHLRHLKSGLPTPEHPPVSGTIIDTITHELFPSPPVPPSSSDTSADPQAPPPLKRTRIQHF